MCYATGCIFRAFIFRVQEAGRAVQWLTCAELEFVFPHLCDSAAHNRTCQLICFVPAGRQELICAADSARAGGAQVCGVRREAAAGGRGSREGGACSGRVGPRAQLQGRAHLPVARRRCDSLPARPVNLPCSQITSPFLSLAAPGQSIGLNLKAESWAYIYCQAIFFWSVDLHRLSRLHHALGYTQIWPHTGRDQDLPVLHCVVW